MPNLKIFVDVALGVEAASRIEKSLADLRQQVCSDLEVDTSFAQVALVAVQGLPDQAQIGAELQIMPGAKRTRAHLEDVGNRLRARLSAIVDTSVAIRIVTLDLANYLVLR